MLTPRQARILAVIQASVARTGRAPSIREIGAAVDVRSPGTIHRHLRALERDGYIRRDPGQVRSIAVLRFPEHVEIDESSSLTDGRAQLTERQREILELVERWIAERGYSPSVREIAREAHLSTSRVHALLEALARKGQIHRDPAKPRAIELHPEQGSNPQFKLVGDNVATVSSLLPAGAFVLPIAREAIVEAGLSDEDYLVVHPEREPQSDGVVAVVLDGIPTIKYLIVADGKLGLLPYPAPSDCDPSPIEGHNARILGKILGVMRPLKAS